jgi:REP element-mobilizing transposase RayT
VKQVPPSAPTLPLADDDCSNRWQAIKIRRVQGERGIWQHRCWKQAIRDDVDYTRHGDYLHSNPVNQHLYG